MNCREFSSFFKKVLITQQHGSSSWSFSKELEACTKEKIHFQGLKSLLSTPSAFALGVPHISLIHDKLVL